MPTTTPLGIVKPAAGSESPNGYVALGALADSVDDYLQEKVEPLRADRSGQAVLSADATPTSTTNVTMPSLDLAVEIAATTDVVWVELDAEISTGVANSFNFIELLVDGVAQSVQLRTRMQTVNDRYSGHKKWRLTGLATGTRTLTFRTRNSAGSTSATVTAAHTVASYCVNAND